MKQLLYKLLIGIGLFAIIILVWVILSSVLQIRNAHFFKLWF